MMIKVLQSDPHVKKGFTLVEVLIAASIFTIVSLIAVTVFVNVLRIQRRVALENAIYEDARVMMERIAREVRENTVDYEEYYNKASDQDVAFAGLTGLNTRNPYGNRYGCYSKRFYNPGTDGNHSGDNPFGALCSNGNTPENDPGCIINKNTLDINTGQNPYAGYVPSVDDLPEFANAFCDKNYTTGLNADAQCGQGGDVINHNVQDQLYLINSTGNQKTMLAKKEINNSPSEHALSLLRLTGEDNDNDGIVETWGTPTASDTAHQCSNGANQFCCSTGFDCTSATTLEGTLTYSVGNLYKGFVPISPTRTDVVSLKFFVAPLEDPRKAFAETITADAIQQQPHVTIVLTVQPSEAARSGFTGDIPKVTIQTTVTSRVYNEVKSFYTVTNGATSVCKSYT